MKSGTKRYVGYMLVVQWQDVGIMLILSPETSHILSVLPLHNSTQFSLYFYQRAALRARWSRAANSRLIKSMEAFGGQKDT